LQLKDHRFLFSGAGVAGCGIAELIASAIMRDSGGRTTIEEARTQIYLLDSKGLVITDREGSTLDAHKVIFRVPMP
jgi:malate dehydrogenase (oxaloacetate-decarboxylating)(NADP+)